MQRHKIKAVRGYKSPVPLQAGLQSSRPTICSASSRSMLPNKVWVTDITYIRTWQGWLYLAVVLDLYARKVVGWSMNGHAGQGTGARRFADGGLAPQASTARPGPQ